MKRSRIIRTLIILFFVFIPVSSLFADIKVHDGVTSVATPVMLTVETGGFIIKRGGEMVEFLVDGTSHGRNLSGGDGFAYKEFTSVKRGLHRIRAESAGKTGEGLLLVLEKGEGVIFIDVEGGLFDKDVFMRPREGSIEALKRIAQRRPLVYLQTGMFGLGITKRFLEENEFPEAPLVKWDNGMIFDEIKEKGLTVRAVIGSPAVIESAVEFTSKAFSFVETESAEMVGTWDEIDKKLQ